MAPPQSETARRLFRALGRDPDQCTAGGSAVVYVGATYAAASPSDPSYSDYVDSYNNYLRAVGNVQAAEPAPKSRRLKARGARRDGRGRYVAARAD